MIASLLRLKPFIARYRGMLGAGIFAFLLARIFEAAAPMFLRQGIPKTPKPLKSQREI